MSAMAAVKVGRTPSLGGGPRSLSRTQAILLETMQLVEPRKSLPVPNHLLESKIYSKIAGNSVVQARPAVIHFSGFELGIMQTAVLRLGNVSTEVQRMHIIPPQTKYFNIKYTKNDRLVPGLTLDCVVEFTADEWRYYYDCIRIHCKGEENLVIPIHAYPVMGADEFPKNLDFPPVPVGQRSERVIPLRCNAPVDFEFQLTYLQPHPAFMVEPMAGLVPAQGEVDITVTFSPTEFSTAHMKLQLVISQFNSRPLVCTVTGSSLPGLAKQIAEQPFTAEEDSELMLDPRSITPVERARKKRKAKQNKENSLPSANKPKEMEKNGIRFPSNLDTPFAVGQVLNQEPGKLRIKDIREAVLAKKGEVEASTRQMKEAMFEMAVRKDVYEERQNQLRWQSKIGDDQISLQQKHDILEARRTAWKEYELERGDPEPEKEALRTCTQCSFRRTIRDSSCIGQEGVKFDTYTNDLWAARHSRLSRFQQAARTIIIRQRADKKIKGLRQMVLDWSKKKFNPAATPGDDEEEEEVVDEELGLRLQIPRVTSVTFPTYVEPNVKDDMAVDALGAVPYKPTEILLPKKTPYFNLKVAQQYSLMGYDHHNVHEASVTYVPPNLVKELRTGAEDEIITLPPPALREPPPEEEPINEGDMRVESVTDTPTSSEPISLRPPDALFKPMEYPPLHIFNPTPGLQVFQAPLPYAEVDPDFHLCPLPRYTSTRGGPHAATQKTYLDREDVIRGVMAWKKFPSQGLISLANTPTLTNVWVPRWSDPFVSDLLPTEKPPLLDGLQPVDESNIAEEDGEEAGVALTPEMVNAQFTLIDPTQPPEEKPKQKDITDEYAVLPMKSHHSQHHHKQEEKPKSVDLFPQGNKLPATNVPVAHHGPVPRDQRELELDFFMKKKYNRLGAKISQRVDQLNSLKTNTDLVLK